VPAERKRRERVFGAGTPGASEGRREGQVRERREERDEEEERVADCLKMNKNKNNNAASSRALFQSSIAWLVYL
jgi:hypothetical protein